MYNERNLALRSLLNYVMSYLDVDRYQLAQILNVRETSLLRLEENATAVNRLLIFRDIIELACREGIYGKQLITLINYKIPGENNSILSCILDDHLEDVPTKVIDVIKSINA